jgi:hypothetical protein
MAYKSYYEKLRDPRWQKKRLEIMERDGFECTDCGSTTKPLNVHHGYYEKGKDPWEYPANSLTTLCEDCHKQVSGLILEINKRLPASTPGLEEVLGILCGNQMAADHSISVFVLSYAFADGIGSAWNLEADSVLSAIDDTNHINGFALQQAVDEVRQNGAWFRRLSCDLAEKLRRKD